MHGVPWALLAWDVLESGSDRIAARLEWNRPELLAVFPYPHVLSMVATLQPDGLTIATTLVAGGLGPVPVSFGFHPYVGLPGVPRADWRLSLPGMRRLLLDGRGLPTGEDEGFPGFDGPLGDKVFDDGFALLSGTAVFSVAGGGRRVSVELVSGYPFAQVFAPAGKELIALEPMTAPTNALATGHGLRIMAPGEGHAGTFRIRVEDVAEP
jgi:galactose mutarotase-like enzyme